MTVTLQVRRFQEAARQAGLKRGDYQARSPRDKHGEYKSLEVTIYAMTTEEQCRKLAETHGVTVYKVDGVVKWHQPFIKDWETGLTVVDLNERDRMFAKFAQDTADWNTEN